MKTRYKFLIAIGIMVVGIVGLNYYSYNDYMNKQKKRIELFFKYNYNNIDSITFTETKKTPMGSLDFYGYFNSDKSNRFIGSVMPYQKEFEVNNGMTGSFARKHAKFENGKTYTVSEIENSQRKKRRENNEENSSSLFSDSAGLSKYSE
ncbi:hypothetical protein A5821_002529 [Enterococcus sp. 7F3_DIV0205]|uniref:DUF1433 domain-containing protein n=1 Tax=Candidatus Enterococcus palustris TaxID=1834189 RepID=A0AAQ3Y6U0_9ENTE|nr:DUF1433 domain-containing protein [Enterococcus sp. 7F3_DIV0205]OTN82960.1 hypothetical protein A5821_002883 [Enterococcus sp. 7F3_DIV0205]